MTSPPDTSQRDEANRYRERLEALLGQRDPIAVLSETSTLLEQIISQHSVQVLRQRPFAGKWTPNEILGHLADTEWMYGHRLRIIVLENQSEVSGWNQDHWVSVQNQNKRESVDFVECFRILRKENLILWKQVPESDYQRKVINKSRGEETLGVFLRLHAGHDLTHLDQINRYLEAIKQSKKS